MKKTIHTKGSTVLPRQFEPIHNDLLDNLSTQADHITAEQERCGWKAAGPGPELNVFQRTRATLSRMQQTHVPLTALVRRLNRAR